MASRVHRLADLNYLPPADLSSAETRAYEEAIVEQLWSFGSCNGWKSVELEGERPDTVIVIRVDGRPDARFALWASEYPTSGAEEYGSLQSAPSVAAAITSDWTAGDL